jgi:rare lipoprotein A
MLVLAACEDGQNPFARLTSGASTAEGSATDGGVAPAARTVERDVESPEAFSSTDQGLWDGRPSLGGVWVAHPDVKGPERVLIRNVANGRETTGALYRREREMPGPRLQVSADAAAALGMLAGAPTEMRVVALRREQVEVAPPPGEAIASGSIEAAPLDPPAAGAAAAPATGAAAAAPSAQSRPAARPGAAAGGRTERAAPAPAPQTAPPAPTSSAPATAPGAAAGASTPPAPTAPPTPSAPAQAAPAPAASAAPLSGGSFVQVGIFSQQSNAESSATTLREAGMVPTVREETSGERKVWRVLVGPVATASDRAALLEKIREAGFADAYVIRN